MLPSNSTERGYVYLVLIEEARGPMRNAACVAESKLVREWVRLAGLVFSEEICQGALCWEETVFSNGATNSIEHMIRVRFQNDLHTLAR
ncbi:MAG: hypothetical protein RID07_21045 [Lacipirellulaceae bacterium]